MACYLQTDNASRWQGTLCVFATVLLIWIANVFFMKFFPAMQTGFMYIYIAAFFGIMILLSVKAPHASAAEVFTVFNNEGNWSSDGLALMVGQITVVYGLVGSDAGAHMVTAQHNWISETGH